MGKDKRDANITIQDIDIGDDVVKPPPAKEKPKDKMEDLIGMMAGGGVFSDVSDQDHSPTAEELEAQRQAKIKKDKKRMKALKKKIKELKDMGDEKSKEEAKKYKKLKKEYNKLKERLESMNASMTDLGKLDSTASLQVPDG